MGRSVGRFATLYISSWILVVVSVLLDLANGSILLSGLLKSDPVSGQDVRSDLPLLKMYTDVPATECSFRCVINKYCGGINWSKGQLFSNCELVNGKSNTAFVQTPGYSYYENDGYDECLSNPCNNGGACNNGYNEYTCTCPTGLIGINCETNIDDCGANMCEHGSQCMDGINSYSCSCPPGIWGIYCEMCPPMKTGFNCEQDCMLSPEGTEYIGTTMTYTSSGYTCQSWNSDSPNVHTYHDDTIFPEGSASVAGNNCRNPNHPTNPLKSSPWCYTTSGPGWELCDIPICPP